jgi:hypothetical protein
VEEVIEHVINELLNDPSIKLQHKDLHYGGPRGASTIGNGSWDEDSSQKYSSSSPLQSQSVLTVNRDYLARLLFWYVKIYCRNNIELCINILYMDTRSNGFFYKRSDDWLQVHVVGPSYERR